ncbi:MAG: hypothetical protein M0Z75_06845 [Nitrospiraceae bacterium]|nr:hypothetical protein [Nitrospiraceae bacterium]
MANNKEIKGKYAPKKNANLINSKIMIVLRNTAAILLFIISGYLICVFTGAASILIPDNTIYAGEKSPFFLIYIFAIAILAFFGLFFRKFKRWRRDLGIIFLLGWFFYIPFMMGTMMAVFNRVRFNKMIEKHFTANGYSFTAFSFVSRIIWVINLLCAIYFIRADRAIVKRGKEKICRKIKK